MASKLQMNILKAIGIQLILPLISFTSNNLLKIELMNKVNDETRTQLCQLMCNQA